MTTAAPAIQGLIQAAFLVSAVSLAGVAHVLWLRHATSLRYAVALDGGRCFHGKRIFGDHKTMRGFMIMIPACGLSFALMWVICLALPDWLVSGLWELSSWQYGLLGLWAGLGFMLGELPNSFVKRRLDIAPGAAPSHGAQRYLFAVVDRIDSILGLLLFVHLAVGVDALAWVMALVIGALIHLVFSAFLYQSNVKARVA